MERQLKMLSLFDGSGGFPLASKMCGIEPVACSEVEPYPIAVTRSRFPKMKHLGSVTDINGADVEPVDVITFGSPCFPEGTLVLTNKGYEPIENLKCGDIVLTHKGNWKPISAVGHKQSKTVLLRGNHCGIVATPNHPFYSAEQCQKWDGKSYIRTLNNVGEWTPAEEMQGKRYAVPNTITGLTIPPIERWSKNQNEPPAIDPNLMYILGRYLGDGWLRNTQRPNRPDGQTFGQILICANDQKADYLEKRLCEVFGENSAVYRVSERTVNKFRLSNQALCKWIETNFGCKADGKTIPAWAYCMSREMKESLLQGYLDSDGYHANPYTWKATTVSRKLAHGIRLLAETLGYSCTIHYADVGETTVIEGRTVNQKPQYQVVIYTGNRPTVIRTAEFNWYKCRSVQPYSDNQTVYNITVEDDHSYIVEGIVVHNCQDLSIAGKRAGLKHEENGDDETTRSGLFMEAVRIIKEMREKTNGVYPRFAVWENVPGAFSSNKGEDFRTVLDEFVKIAEPEAPEVPMPDKNGWPHADILVGDGWSIAYRVLDAQFWGVPQRRRRIYLVADFRDERAGEILFECEGQRGYFAEGGTPWQGVAGDTENGFGAAAREGNCLICMATQQGGAEVRTDNKAPTLTAAAGMSGNNQPVVAEKKVYESHPMGSYIKELGDISPAVTAKWHKGSADTPLVVEGTPMCISYDAIGNGDGNTVSTLTCGHQNRITDYTSIVIEPVPCTPINDKATRWRGGGASRNHDGSGNGLGIGADGDPSPTLTAGDRHAVAYTLKIRSGCEGGGKGALVQEDKSAILATNNDQYLFQPMEDNCLTPWDVQSRRIFTPSGAISSLYGGEGGGRGYVFYPDQPKPNKYEERDISSGMKARDHKDETDLVCEKSRTRYVVRRLTPTECARLQGFPDEWGHPEQKDDFTDEDYQFWLNVRNTHAAINGKTQKEYSKAQMLSWYNKLHTDSSEYKMWGNGIALPCALYVMQGVSEVLRDGTTA